MTQSRPMERLEERPWKWRSMVIYVGVSKNRGGPPKSSILIRFFHYFHHPFSGTSFFGNTHVFMLFCVSMNYVRNKRHLGDVFKTLATYHESCVPWKGRCWKLST